MAILTSCARSFFRSSSFRNASSRVAAEAKPSRNSSPFHIPKQTRSFRSPVELSCCVDSLMPFHTVTASALLNSMLSVPRAGYGWTLQGCIDDA